MIILADNDFVKIMYSSGKGNTTLISFSSINFLAMSRGETRISNLMAPEFVNSSPEVGDRFWILDKKRSWGNLIDWSWVVGTLKSYLENKQVVCVGTCFGGHNAIKFSYYADVHRVFAFTPHWSIHPEVITQSIFDAGTSSVRKAAIEKMQHKSLSGMFKSTTEYLFFWTPDLLDIPHMLLFPDLPNIKKIFFPSWAHGIPANLLRHKILYQVIEQGIIAKDPLKNITLILERTGIEHRV